MSETMVERVAKAIDRNAWVVSDSELHVQSRDLSRPDAERNVWESKARRRREARRRARNAIAAMREPTQYMVDESSVDRYAISEHEFRHEPLCRLIFWHAIDAALREGQDNQETGASE